MALLSLKVFLTLIGAVFIAGILYDLWDRRRIDKQGEWEYVKLTCKDKTFGAVEHGMEFCRHKDRVWKRGSDPEARCERDFCPRVGGRYECNWFDNNQKG